MRSKRVRPKAPEPQTLRVRNSSDLGTVSTGTSPPQGRTKGTLVPLGKVFDCKKYVQRYMLRYSEKLHFPRFDRKRVRSKRVLPCAARREDWGTTVRSHTLNFFSKAPPSVAAAEAKLSLTPLTVALLILEY